jgi:hypothetical protein
MEASCLLKIPSDAEWQYEPKYNPKGESLNRYFRVVGPYYRSSKRIDMLDREIVISAEIFHSAICCAASPAVSGTTFA